MAATDTRVRFAGFADYSPAQLREKLLPEDHEAFDSSFRKALDEVAQTLSLEPLDDFLEHWRRYTWSQHDMGPERWHAMLAKADYILEHGHPPPGTVTYTAEQMRQQIAERLTQGR